MDVSTDKCTICNSSSMATVRALFTVPLMEDSSYSPAYPLEEGEGNSSISSSVHHLSMDVFLSSRHSSALKDLIIDKHVHVHVKVPVDDMNSFKKLEMLGSGLVVTFHEMNLTEALAYLKGHWR